MATGDIYRVNLRWDTAGGTFFGESVLHYTQEGGIVQPTPSQDLGMAVAGIIAPALIAVASPVFEISSCQVRGVTSPTEGADTSWVPIPGGLAPGETNDSALCPLLHWKTGLIGRSFRGRTFLCPATEAVTSSGGALSPTYRTNVGAAGTACINIPAGVDHGEWQLVIASFFSGGIERVTPLATPVISVEIPGLYGILKQRRT